MILPPFPTSGITNWQAFGPRNLSAFNGVWQSWAKPPGASMLMIIAVGGGGAGAGGQSVAAAARSGGGGGGTAGISRWFGPSWVFPDIIYIQVGPGGTGGAAASNGNPGGITYVAIAPDSTTAAFHIVSANGGSTGAATGTAGGGASTSSIPSFSAWGPLVQVAGQAGASGGANTGAIGGSVAPSTSVFLTGGAGAAGSSTANSVHAGGDISALNPTIGASMWRTIAGGIAGVSGTTAGSPGQAGYNYGVPLAPMFSRNTPLFFSGGSGGGSGGASLGGAGGPGAWGCGGGGGGAGSTGGVGGRGGDGFVIIGAF